MFNGGMFVYLNVMQANATILHHSFVPIWMLLICLPNLMEQLHVQLNVVQANAMTQLLLLVLLWMLLTYLLNQMVQLHVQLALDVMTQPHLFALPQMQLI